MDATDLFHAYMDASADEDTAQRDLSRVLASRDDFANFAAYEDAVRAARAALTVAQGFARAAMQAYMDAECAARAQILADRAAEEASKKDNITEQSRRFREIPSTLVDVCDMGSEILVHVETVCGLYRESHKVATFATMLDATAFVASTYGLTRQAMDGDGATEGWWLS